MARNSILKNKYDKQRVFLLLSGESLNYIDIPKLKEEYTAGCGFLFLDNNIVNLPLSFFLATEPGPLMDKLKAPGWFNWPEKLIPSNGKNQGYIFLKNIKKHFTDKGTISFLDANKIAYYKKIKLFDSNEPNVYFIKSKPYLFTTKKSKPDLTKRFIGGDGSIFNLILIMMYMGFKEIYLCGGGYTYEPIYQDHFYDNFVFPKSMGIRDAEIEARKTIDIRNSQTDSNLEYYGLFEKNDFFRIMCIQRKRNDLNKEKHRILNSFAVSQGVKIFNIVPARFESPIYEKISWKEVENKIS